MLPPPPPVTPFLTPHPFERDVLYGRPHNRPVYIGVHWWWTDKQAVRHPDRGENTVCTKVRTWYGEVHSAWMKPRRPLPINRLERQLKIQPTEAWALNDDREQIWGRTLGYDTTGKMRNILQTIFRILPVVDFLHSAFYPYPRLCPSTTLLANEPFIS